MTGLVSNALTYSSGHLKLTYHNGDAYNGGALRQTEIIFLCDSSKDIGEPEFASETGKLLVIKDSFENIAEFLFLYNFLLHKC